MKYLTRLAFPLFLTLAAYGCSCDNNGVDGICPGGAVSCGQACATPPDGVDGGLAPGCGAACTSTSDCDAGFYCGSDDTCTADCFGTGDEFCPDGICTTEGRCFVPEPDGGGNDGDAGDGGNECAGDVPVTTVTPNIVFLVDQSGSMSSDFGGSPRWDVVRNALIGTGGADTGLIGSLEASVRFGVSLYEHTGSNGDLDCPTLTNIPDDMGDVDVALNNHSTIESVYSSEDDEGHTPTGESVNALIASLPDAILTGSDPTIIILATDGEPDTCNSLDPQIGQQEAVNAVADAYNTHGILTFPVAVGGAVGDGHMMDIAVAGITGVARTVDCDHTNDYTGDLNAMTGCPSSGTDGQPELNCDVSCDAAWVASSPPASNECDAGDLSTSTPCFYRPSSATLQAAIEALIQGQRSCVVDLDNQLMNHTMNCADGVVTLDLDGPGGAAPQTLSCDDANGFRMLNNIQFELSGSACSDFLDNPDAVIDASFPCGNIVIG